MEDKRETEHLINCALCANMCKHSCPTYLATGRETVTPQKIARLILYEEKSFIEDKSGFFNVMFQSAMCGACKAHCIYDNYDLRKFIQKGRSKAFKEGMLPDETRHLIEKFMSFGNPYGERQLLQKGTGDIGYFVSCSAYNDQKLLKAIDKIITVSRGQVHQFGGADICCGAPLYYAGDMDGFKKAAEKMKGEIKKRKLQKVIVDCPNCMKMLTEIYREVGVDLDVEFIHTTQFFNDILKEGKIEVNRANTTATFHDPCILVNDIGITAAPREVLAVLGYEIKEPVYSREDTHCCGGVCGARIGDCSLSDKLRLMRISELKQTGADVYLSACPTCKAVLSDVGMKDITELVAEQMIN
jgi:Fe-S oxidoreductase